MIQAPLAVSLGDPAGIGAEVIAKSWERREAEGLPPFFAVGDAAAVESVWNGPMTIIDEPADAIGVFDSALPVIKVADVTTPPGGLDLIGARNALDALELAVGLARSGAASALVTGPVSKSRLQLPRDRDEFLDAEGLGAAFGVDSEPVERLERAGQRLERAAQHLAALAEGGGGEPLDPLGRDACGLLAGDDMDDGRHHLGRRHEGRAVDLHRQRRPRAPLR